MRQAGLSHMFVLDRERRLVGLCEAEEVARLAERDERELRAAVDDEAPKVQRRTPLREVLPLFVEDGDMPVAVVGEGERLEGVIVRGALIAGLTTSVEPHDEGAETSAASAVPARIRYSRRAEELRMLAFLQSELVPSIPLAEWTDTAVDWITDTFEGVFDVPLTAIDLVVGSLEYVLLAPPALLMVAILGVIAFLLAGWRVALFTVFGLVFVISLDLWEAAMQTLALVLSATAVALVIGIPIGIIAAKSGALETAIRPILDVAQTMPAFVYLVPIVVILGIGAGPALIATVIFAMPPAVRLTMLGIQQVPKDTVEAAHAFGATPWQTLFKVELPLSLKTIMAGVNQVIMLSLSMVVMAGVSQAGVFGEPVVTGLSQLNVGISFSLAGLALWLSLSC